MRPCPTGVRRTAEQKRRGRDKMQLEYSDKVKGMRPSIIRELLKQMSDPQLISFAGATRRPTASRWRRSAGSAPSCWSRTRWGRCNIR